MAQEEVVVTEAAAAAAATKVDPAPMAEVDSPKKAAAQEPAPAEEEKPITKFGFFKEESNVVSDLQTPEKKALEELKTLLQAAISNGDFSPPPAAEPAAETTEDSTTEPAEETTEDSTTEASAPAPAVESQATAEDPAPPSDNTAVQDKPVVDDDGAKTVEAIESTVVPVTAAPTQLPDKEATAEAKEKNPDESITKTHDDVIIIIWGIPLLKDERSDTVLLKFLRARDFKAKEALTMIKNAVKWREEFGIEKLVEEDLGVPEFEKAVFMSGADREGHPVCYNVYGEFQNKELYEKAFGDGEKRQRFLRWRIQYLEKGIRELLDFAPAGVSTMVQVTDLSNSPGLLKRELRQALDLLQNNYPEFVAKQVFINVPWWYLAFNRIISPFLTQRTKSKFVFAGPSRSAEVLFNYISPEQVPVQFGGLNKENDTDFSTADAVTEVNMKPSSKQIVEIPVTEKCQLVWELRVLGWDVTVGAEFVPSSESRYTVVIQKSQKLAANHDEPVAKNSFKIGEAGKVVITVDNATSKKKKMLYRYKAKDCTEF